MQGAILALFKHGGLFFMLILKDPNPILTVKVIRLALSLGALLCVIYGGLLVYEKALSIIS